MPQPRKVLSLSHTLAGHNVLTHNNSLANLCRGVGERVLYTNGKLDRPIIAERGIFESSLHRYRHLLSKAVGRRSPVAHNTFVSYYKGRRLATYQRAADSLVNRPCCPRDARLKTFVKAEKHNLTLKRDPVPRVIQPRDPRYNVELGSYLRPIEMDVYDAIDSVFGSPTIMSHYNSYTQAEKLKEKWDLFHHPVCIGLDASRFDQHVSVPALKFEHSIYDAIFRCRKLRWLLKLQLNNHGTASAKDGYFRYTKHGSRMSGDMNTSMGNKILMCLMAHNYLTSLKIPYSFANNGDDCLVFTDRRHVSNLDGLKDYFVKYGFNIVREDPVFEFEQVEFCQTRPVCVNDIWRMCRNYKTCLSKDLTCINLGHNINEYRAWLFDVGKCGMSIAADVPVLGSFYKMLLRIGTPTDYSNKFENDFAWYINASRNATAKHHDTDQRGRYSYWLSTGLSPDEQEVIEQYLDTFIWGDDKRQLIETLSVLFT